MSNKRAYGSQRRNRREERHRFEHRQRETRVCYQYRSPPLLYQFIPLVCFFRRRPIFYGYIDGYIYFFLIFLVENGVKALNARTVA